jgi:hypothetical protein
MIRGFVIFILLNTSAFSKAQSTAGITGVRDTSYNILNEYKHLKTILT